MYRMTSIRLAWCEFGAATSVALLLFLIAPIASPLLLASMDGSAILLFGLTRAHAAPPHTLFGGSGDMDSPIPRSGALPVDMDGPFVSADVMGRLVDQQPIRSMNLLVATNSCEAEFAR